MIWGPRACVIDDIVHIYANYPDLETEVLVASVRSPMHVLEGKIGAGVATLPPDVLHSMFKHPLTDKGLDAFLADGRKPASQSSRQST